MTVVSGRRQKARVYTSKLLCSLIHIATLGYPD